MGAQIRQAPGWWPSLIRVCCDDCGFTSGVYDTDEWRDLFRARMTRDDHQCGQKED